MIGVPAGSNGCEDWHFHLAIKRSMPDSERGLCYYVDPSPFLDRMQPVPTWHQECKDFTFKHIGDVVDFSKLTEGFSVVLEELKRYVSARCSTLSVLLYSKGQRYVSSPQT